MRRTWTCRVSVPPAAFSLSCLHLGSERHCLCAALQIRNPQNALYRPPSRGTRGTFQCDHPPVRCAQYHNVSFTAKDAFVIRCTTT